MGWANTLFKYLYPHVACRCHLRFISTLVFSHRDRLNLHIADPEIDDFPFSTQSTKFVYALLRLCKCFRPAMLVRSFTVSKLLNEISGTRYIINHLNCTRYALFICSFEYCHLLELYVKCDALYQIFIPQSFISGNNSNGSVAGRVWGMVFWRPHKQENAVRHTKSGRIRGMVVDEGGRSTGVLLYLCCRTLSRAT